MPFVIALAVRELHLTAEEAVLGGDGRRRRRAARAPTSAASCPAAGPTIVVLDAPSHTHLAYRPGVPLVAGVLQAGEVTYRDGLLWPA